MSMTDETQTSAGGRAAKKGKKNRGPVAGAVEFVVTIGVAIGLALLVQAFIVKPYKVPSGSMEPTLRVGQRILVSRMSTHPKVGDIVVFHPPLQADRQICGNSQQGQNSNGQEPCDQSLPEDSHNTFVKRLVGLPGDHLKIVNGKVIRNGKQENAPYAQACTGGASQGCSFAKTIVVPPGEYFMMGDNRPDSDDSRYWGPIKQSWIIGSAFATYWPPDRLGFF